MNLQKIIKEELEFFDEVTTFLTEQHRGLRKHIALNKTETKTAIHFIFARVIAHWDAVHSLIEDGYNHEAIALLEDTYGALGLARYFASVGEKNRLFRIWVEGKDVQETTTFALRERLSELEMTPENTADHVQIHWPCLRSSHPSGDDRNL